MKQIILLIATIVLATTHGIAQKGTWTIGLSTGIRGEMFQSVDDVLIVYPGRQVSTPSADITAAYAISEVFSIESGLTFVENRLNFKTYNFNYTSVFGSEQNRLYSSIQFPLRVKLNIPVGSSRFSFFMKAGMTFQFSLSQVASDENHIIPEKNVFVDHFSGSPRYFEYDMDFKAPIHSFNVLCNNTVGFSYTFSNGLGLHVFGEYYLGLRNMAYVSINHRHLSSDHNVDFEGEERLKYRGDYWNIGLGLSYKISRP